MDEPMNYALIAENGTVENIIWLCSLNRTDFPNAVCVANRPVAVGDVYQDGVFTRAGEVVLTYPEQIALLSERILELGLTGEGRAFQLVFRNVNGSRFTIDGGVELLVDLQRRTL